VSTVTPRTSSARNEARQVAPRLIELITHLAFYSGGPTAMTAGRIAVQVLGEKKS
jgi:alkylhydroperoxidase/carboxymuconolactone decarboxylase family protein YurZ